MIDRSTPPRHLPETECAVLGTHGPHTCPACIVDEWTRPHGDERRQTLED